MFLGCLLLGMGIGMLFGETGAGLLIGVGLGFILSSLKVDKWMRHWPPRDKEHDVLR